MYDAGIISESCTTECPKEDLIKIVARDTLKPESKYISQAHWPPSFQPCT